MNLLKDFSLFLFDNKLEFIIFELSNVMELLDNISSILKTVFLSKINFLLAILSIEDYEELIFYHFLIYCSFIYFHKILYFHNNFDLIFLNQNSLKMEYKKNHCNSYDIHIIFVNLFYFHYNYNIFLKNHLLYD